MKLLEINNMKKNYGDLKVIKDISISVEEGDVLAIIGHYGYGKSTLLRCATCLKQIPRIDLCGERL